MKNKTTRTYTFTYTTEVEVEVTMRLDADVDLDTLDMEGVEYQLRDEMEHACALVDGGDSLEVDYGGETYMTSYTTVKDEDGDEVEDHEDIDIEVDGVSFTVNELRPQAYGFMS